MAETAVLTTKQMRRKRPSFSPRKTRKQSLPIRSHSETPTKRSNNDFVVNSIYHIDVSSLEFNEFSLLDMDYHQPVCSEWHDLLFKYL